MFIDFRAKLREAKNQNLRLINFNYQVTRNTGLFLLFQFKATVFM